ncbi:MAG: hypothetical protein LBG64_00620 [Pseudomonadales bacterium]|nr:hypothetical protein [Pseudomonadales bacterium]
MDNGQLSQQQVAEIIKDPQKRRKLAHESHLWFFSMYFAEHMKYAFAPFHREMFGLTEDNFPMTLVLAFRGSAKSTICTQSYPIWAITGKQKKKFILIVSQTQAQARIHLLNIKRELENNELLKADIGPFQSENDEWNNEALVIKDYNAKIMSVSVEQGIRGVRFGAHRPDLIICDDIESLSVVATRESRDKLQEWFSGELMPCGTPSTKYLLLGSVLDDDSFLMRLAKQYHDPEYRDAMRVFSWPIMIDEKPSWPSMFPDMSAIKKLRKRVNNHRAWMREYMLQIVDDEQQIIMRDWLHYYDEPPEVVLPPIYVGVDLAVSERTNSDYTAIVMAIKAYVDGRDRIVILPEIINKRMGFPAFIDQIMSLSDKYTYIKVFIERVGQQEAYIQQLDNLGIKAIGVPVSGTNKAERLHAVSNLISEGVVIFPSPEISQGVELLIEQMIKFGGTKHDDLVDALTLLVLAIIGSEPDDFYMYNQKGDFDRSFRDQWRKTMKLNSRKEE